MENNTVRISIDELSLPVVSDCNMLTAPESFFHMDRIADFNVMIYVTEGVMYVTEEGRDYEISAGEMLFLKGGLPAVIRFLWVTTKHPKQQKLHSKTSMNG